MRGLSAADVANLTSLFGGRGTLTLDATTLKGASDINGSPGDANIDGWQIVQCDQRRGMAAAGVSRARACLSTRASADRPCTERPPGASSAFHAHARTLLALVGGIGCAPRPGSLHGCHD